MCCNEQKGGGGCKNSPQRCEGQDLVKEGDKGNDLV